MRSHARTLALTLALARRLAKVDMYHYQMASGLWTLVAQQWAVGVEVLSRAMSAHARHPQEGEGVVPQAAQPLVWWKRTFEEPLVPVVKLGQRGLELAAS